MKINLNVISNKRLRDADYLLEDSLKDKYSEDELFKLLGQDFSYTLKQSKGEYFFDFYSFGFEFDKIDDRSNDFLNFFKDFLKRNSSKILSMFNKINAIVIRNSNEKKSNKLLFKFLEKNGGYKYYVDYGYDKYIAKKPEYIEYAIKDNMWESYIKSNVNESEDSRFDIEDKLKKL